MSDVYGNGDITRPAQARPNERLAFRIPMVCPVCHTEFEISCNVSIAMYHFEYRDSQAFRNGRYVMTCERHGLADVFAKCQRTGRVG